MRVSKAGVLRSAAAIVIGLAAAAATVLPAQAATGSDEVVRTAGGAIRGLVTADHRAFLGIPYAAPPVDELRWRAPRPAAPWSGVRDGTKAGAPCPQSPSLPDDPPVVGSEDCLFLNVDTPRAARGRLPVMVFLHGGGFIGGRAALYDPSRLTARGVIVVTPNYRLGALGYLRHPSMRDPYAGNFGTADQQAALRWVRENIAAFGGDPRNVTLWGESAGAYSVCTQLASPAARGLFDKAIVQSGPCGNDMLTPGTAERRAVPIAAGLGCTDSARVMECLRGRSVGELVGLGEEGFDGLVRRNTDLPWLPVARTAAVPEQPLDALRRGAGVPMIHGGTRDEMRGFVAGRHPSLTAAEYREVVGGLYEADAPEVLAEYPADGYASPGLTLATVLGDEGRMQGACAQLPALEAASRRVPVYAYEFAEPNPQTVGTIPLGAHHGFDVRQMFGNRSNPGGVTSPVGERLIRFWTEFARTGDPGTDWPRYRDATVVSIRGDGTGPVDLARTHNCGFWRGLSG